MANVVERAVARDVPRHGDEACSGLTCFHGRGDRTTGCTEPMLVFVSPVFLVDAVPCGCLACVVAAMRS